MGEGCLEDFLERRCADAGGEGFGERWGGGGGARMQLRWI